MTQDMVKMMSQDKMIGKREILSSSPSPWFSRFLRAMLLLVMVTLGVGNVWGQDLPFVVTTDADNSGEIEETEKHYYMIQSFINSAYYMRPNGTSVNTLNIITDDMKWYFLKAGDPENNVQYYYICDKDGRYLYFSRAQGSMSDRTWIELKTNITDIENNCKFTIEKKNTKGWSSYNIIPRGNERGYCLNKQGRDAGAYGGATKTGDIQVYDGYDDQSSNWFFIDVNDFEWTLHPECFTVSTEETTNYYKIQNQNFTDYYIMPGATNVKTSNSTSEDDLANMVWYFKEASHSDYMTYYYIIHAKTGKYLRYMGDGVPNTSSTELAEHTGSETVEDEKRFQFIVARGANANESRENDLGITFNIVPQLLENAYTNNQYKYYCLSSTKTKGSNLAIEDIRSDKYAHWNFVSTTFSGAWADPVITCDATGTVTITCEDGAEVFYTWNNDIPTGTETETNFKYDANSKPTVTTGKTTIKARVIKSGKQNSNVVTETIVYNPTITLTATSYTYNGTAYSPVSSVDYVDSNNPENKISFEVNTDYIVSYKKEDNVVDDCIDAGTYNIVLTDADGGDYIVCGTGSFTIDKATLTVTAKPKTITYGAEPANDGVTYEGFVGTETEDVLGGTLDYEYTYTQFGDVSDADHTYTITPKGLSSTNYTFNYIPGTLTVNPKEVGLSWSTPTSFTYDGTAHTLTATATGTVNGDVIGVTVTTSAKEGSSLTGYDAINAGSYTATASTLTLNGTDTPAGNYTLPAANTQDFTISQKALTVTAKPHTITYGDEPANDGVTYSGFIEGDNENNAVSTTGLDYDYTYTQFGDVGSYSITPKGLTSTNYSITYNDGTLTVNQKEVGIEWSNTSLAYNGLEQKPTATATGLVNNDEIGVTVEGAQTDIGTGTAIATGLTGTGGKEGNYKLPTPNPSTTFEITTAVLIVTANDKAIIFGDEPSNSGVTYSGFIVGQDESTPGVLSGTLSYYYNTAEDGLGTEYSAGSNAGTYYIIPSGLTSTVYEVRFVAGTLTVNPKVVKDNPDTGAGEAAITILLSDIPEGGYVYDGIAKTPTVTVKYGDTVIPSGDGGEYTVEYTSNINAGTNTATVTITDKDGGNYTVSGTTTFSIGKAPLTATADNVNITYGDVAPTTYTISYTGFVNNEDKTVLTTAPTAACTYTQGNDAGNYDITVTGGEAQNYEITLVDGTLTVGPKTVSNPTIEISETSFEYDGTEKKPDVTSVKDGDTDIPSDQYQWSWSNNINAAGSADENAPTVIVTNVDNGNYTINGIVTFTITPKSIGNGTTSAEGVVISFDENENVKITCPIENLTKDKDFTFSGPTDEVWTITGIGNYSGGAQVMRIVEDFYNTGVATGENIKDVAAFQASTDMVISGKDVYIVTDVNLTKHKVVLSKITYAPKDTPVLLLTDLEGTDLETTAGVAATPIQVETGDEADTSGNILKRLSGAEGLQVTFGKVFMFYLGKFVLTTEGTLEAGSFYFDNPNPPSSSAAGVRLSIVIDETTDIDGIKEYDNTGTAIDRWYSLDGRRLNGKPTKKGLYIKNGQKVVVK